MAYINIAHVERIVLFLQVFFNAYVFIYTFVNLHVIFLGISVYMMLLSFIRGIIIQQDLTCLH